MTGEDITDDIIGSEGKALYDSVKTSLIRKYGDPDVNDERYSQWWLSGRYLPGLSLILVGSSSIGIGHLLLVYESEEYIELSDESGL